MTRLHVLIAMALLLLASTGVTAQERVKPIPLKDLPPPWRGEVANAYRADPYIAAATALQAEPKTAADTLKQLIKDADPYDTEKAIILCRMLFTAKPRGEFRCPRLGVPLVPGGGDVGDWMLAPVEVVDGVPFLIVPLYNVGGLPEPASKYLNYCLEECDWTGEKYKPKDKETKAKALAKLLADKRWKKGLTKDEKEFLSSQVK